MSQDEVSEDAITHQAESRVGCTGIGGRAGVIDRADNSEGKVTVLASTHISWAAVDDTQVADGIAVQGCLVVDGPLNLPAHVRRRTAIGIGVSVCVSIRISVSVSVCIGIGVSVCIGVSVGRSAICITESAIAVPSVFVAAVTGNSGGQDHQKERTGHLVSSSGVVPIVYHFDGQIAER